MDENRPVLKLKSADISITKKEIISEIIERPNIKPFKNLLVSEKLVSEKIDGSLIEKIIQAENINEIKQELSIIKPINNQSAISNLPPYKKFKEIHKWLRRKCPKVITYKPSKVFSIGIHKEIAKLLDISVTDAKLFCKYYCDINYQRLLIEGIERFNLNNEVTGIVTEEQAIRAKAFVESREKAKQTILDDKFETTL